MTPFLKWAGGKTWLAPRLRALYDPFRATSRFVDLCCGAGGASFGVAPERALLNDTNPHLINLLWRVAAGFKNPVEMVNDAGHYTWARERFNRLILDREADTAEAAGLFYYLNRTGFNGLIRFNRSGLFNVPFGSYKTINYVTDFSPWQRAMEWWKFSCGDFERIVLHPSDFLYIDPPYDGTWGDYSAGGFGWSDQVRLAAFAAEHPGPVVASNSATERVMDLWRGHGFTVETAEAPRRISCDGNRANALEMLATRGVAPLAPATQLDLFNEQEYAPCR